MGNLPAEVRRTSVSGVAELILHPGEGSETVALALSTVQQPEESPRSRKPSLWYGQGFTKTQ